MEIDPERKVIEKFNIATGWVNRIADGNSNNAEVGGKIETEVIKDKVGKSVCDIFDK